MLSDNNDGTVNLILSSNICVDGKLDSGECLYAWGNSSYVSNKFGPIGAFDILNRATSSWNNIPNIVINFSDSASSSISGYKSIVTSTSDSITSIIQTDGTVSGTYENLKSRLPYRSEIEAAGCLSDSCSVSWLKDNIFANGYWLADSSSSFATSSKYGYYAISVDAKLNNQIVTVNYGIRPVITVPKYMLKG